MGLLTPSVGGTARGEAAQRILHRVYVAQRKFYTNSKHLNQKCMEKSNKTCIFPPFSPISSRPSLVRALLDLRRGTSPAAEGRAFSPFAPTINVRKNTFSRVSFKAHQNHSTAKCLEYGNMPRILLDVRALEYDVSTTVYLTLDKSANVWPMIDACSIARVSLSFLPRTFSHWKPNQLEIFPSNRGLTDARIALFSLSKICLPRRTAAFEPKNRHPMEVIDKSRRPFSDVGQNVALCKIGKRGLKRVKYMRTHRFLSNG
jgi:hypothetical protein